jgi:BirA family biotin operon repressor/biotin-[acetyl-CoA-carboxylase] ligase
MTVARDIARKGAEEGTVIIAEEQVEGRGRSKNTWFTPQGNLAISIILKPRIEDVSQLIMIASLAVYHTIFNMCGIHSDIKWPNDVLIGGKKVSGILIENEVRSDIVNYAIIGIGINIQLDPLHYPEISNLATSLVNETRKNVSQYEVCSGLLDQMERLYLEVRAGNSLYFEWKEHIDTIGKYIQASFGDTVIRGKAESVTESGNLVIRTDDGNLTEIIAGEVTIIK